MCVCLKALLLGCFPLPLLSSSPLFSLKDCGENTLPAHHNVSVSSTSIHCSPRTYLCSLQEKKTNKKNPYILLSLDSTPPPSPPPLLFPLRSRSLSFDIVSSLQTPIQLWHYASWSFTLRGLCPVRLRPHSGSDPRASVTLCLMLYSKWGCRISQALSQSKNPNI